MRRAAFVLPACMAFAALASAGSARSTASLQMRLVPEHPAADTTATIRFYGQTATTGIPLVLAVSTATCPPSIPASAKALVPPSGVTTGAVAGEIRVRVSATTTRFCGYLVPAEQDAYGKVTYTATAQPMATAQAEVIGKLRVEGGVLGGSPTSPYVSNLLVTFDRSGTRATRLQVACGGNPRKPPSLGKVFIGKRFIARVSIPIAPRMHWSGRILPDNSANYDKPLPAQWTKPVSFTLDVRVVYVDGKPGRLVGTGRLTSPGLPCGVLRRYV